ncbi:Golgi to ER traffic protein 4 homolog isoform X2 [Ostrea edulis]|uniref:Golgi to ER traffic protein 4 homolog isoform X2 n=1 Tax=Ostrea edulis TaxID=37623 RepID=UPI002095FE3C|nr:Golgi to ER traffic protein 4 homolog isoform X2 [Ostrea edulis]
MATDRRSGGIERVLSKCQSCVEAGNYYEAHQMYRTLYFRYKGQKKYTEAANLLYHGALTLRKHDQTSSFTDLSFLLIDLLNQSETPVSEDIIEKIVTIFKGMEPQSEDRHTFLVSAVRWTMKANSEHKRGHPDLHQKFGLSFWEEKNYGQARYHLLHSQDGQNCALMLIECHVNGGYPYEVDLFIAQAVLQYLCLRNKDTAQVAFVKYTENHPDVQSGPPYVHPLLNFLWFLLLAVEGGRVAVFSILCEKYQASINRDPSYREYLDQIGQLFFGLPPPPKQSQGLFGNLLQSIMGDDGDEDSLQQSTSSDGPAPQPSSQSATLSPVELD